MNLYQLIQTIQYVEYTHGRRVVLRLFVIFVSATYVTVLTNGGRKSFQLLFLSWSSSCLGYSCRVMIFYPSHFTIAILNLRSFIPYSDFNCICAVKSSRWNMSSFSKYNVPSRIPTVKEWHTMRRYKEKWIRYVLAVIMGQPNDVAVSTMAPVYGLIKSGVELSSSIHWR